ncbi:MAG: 4-(cytidine 5'-diphospho)-2-C-methyl-D-erythritol kinase [Opitutus sp.]|nr:4-(cytidine 5'-diphospho)-2-C-methyl-D-erythritol kinase [Opitutus sp.]
MSPLSVLAPAKLNLFLAVTGRRADGYHDLVSVAAPLEFGDTLTMEPAETFSLTCDDPAVPTDETNLVLIAARAWAEATGRRGGAKFVLQKRIPMGAGLGGGSSDAVAALRALNAREGRPLESAALAELAARVGSDCALFFPGGPVVMRGRGERVAPLAAPVAARLRGRRVLIFQPGFAIATPWAYAQLAAKAPGSYWPARDAEARLAAWIGEAGAPAEALLFNNMEQPAFAKFIALPALLDRLLTQFGLVARMSGSGSACFALLPEPATVAAGSRRPAAGPAVPVAAITQEIRAAWGPAAFVVETRLA